MGPAEISIIHHVGLVLLLLWILASIGWCHPFAFFASLLYLYKVNERYSVRLGKRLQFEERKSANKRRLLLGPESVRWLNRVVERVWPICMEQIASQQFLLPIIPWFLDNYKPWTAVFQRFIIAIRFSYTQKKAAVQHLYLGRSPPIFTEVRVLHEPDGDDDMTLELGMNFLSAEDMTAVLAVQLRKRLGFGMRAKMHVTSMHVEGKVLVGLKFIQNWPFIGRVRICFVEPPYFQMTVKPIFHHGVDVSELPGIAGWLDKVLAIAFEETLVEPNMLVVDVEKFASATTESWFTMDEKHPIAFAKVEIIEADGMKPGDLSGLANPYVKGQLGPYRFRTKIQKKTLAPKWHEEFKIPISSWEAPNVLSIQVCDKDRIVYETLGGCCINTNDFRGGQRHDKWLTLTKIKAGRLHLAVTILGEKEKVIHAIKTCKKFKVDSLTSIVIQDSNRGKGSDDEGPSGMAEAPSPMFPRSSLMDENFTTGGSLCKDQYICDEFEPISIKEEEDQRKETRQHHPGGDISKTLQSIKGRDHRPKTKVHYEDSECSNSPGSTTSRSSDSSNNNDRDVDGDSKLRGPSIIRRGLWKIGDKFHKNSKHVYKSLPGEKQGTSDKVMVDDGHTGSMGDHEVDQESRSSEKGDGENIRKIHIREKEKSILKQIGNSADSLKDRGS